MTKLQTFDIRNFSKVDFYAAASSFAACRLPIILHNFSEDNSSFYFNVLSFRVYMFSPALALEELSDFMENYHALTDKYRNYTFFCFDILTDKLIYCQVPKKS